MDTDIISNLPVDKKIAIIIRHAERFEIESMQKAMEAQLTKKGKKASYNLGFKLTPYSPFNIYYSFVQRCKETAENIHKGILSNNGKSGIKGHLSHLGGPYITGNWLEVANIVDSLGQSIFLRKWFDGEFPPDLVMPLEQAANIQLGILLDQLLNEACSTINITHDWNIMLLREFFFNARHEDIPAPDFLEGLYAYLQDDIIHLNNQNTDKIIHRDSINCFHNL